MGQLPCSRKTVHGKTADEARAKLRTIRVHDLRHTAASSLKKLGVSPRDAMEILGHSRISVTTEIYTHGDGESREDAIKIDTGCSSEPVAVPVAIKRPRSLIASGLSAGGATRT
ncbi:tyrosine-type recombinase/integrase [Nonomuraea fuscirosea]|uniref:tyrosine-type recombinase/integrase n=1 Tax=Nonomuraea fuscirosea TaxID=1291556 RepID=UPI0034257984